MNQAAVPFVRMLLVADAAGEPMRSCERVEIVRGKGIVGDRYFAGLGHWSDPKWPDQELTLVEEEVAGRLGVPPQSLRRNVVTAGVDLASLIGKRFRFGADGPLALGVRTCEPCTYLEHFTRPGMARELAGGGGGLRARILTSGWIRVGDQLLIEPA